MRRLVVHATPLVLACLVLAGEPLGAQSCDTAAVRSLRALVDTQRVDVGRIRLVLQPAFVPARLDTTAASIDSIARALTCLPPGPGPGPIPGPPPGALPRLGIADVPRVRLDPRAVRPTTFARTIVASTCAALQTAIDTSRPGDLIELAGVAQCAQTTWLPKRNHPPGPVTVIRPFGTAHTLGVRATPSTIAGRPKLLAPANLTHALATRCGARDFWVEGFEIAPAPGVTFTHTLIPLGDGSPCDSSAQNLHLVGNWIHGLPGIPAVRAIALNTDGSIVEDNWCEEFHQAGADTQCIGAWNGRGPYRIRNNYLAAAGETILFGGAPPSRPNVLPSDIELCRNHFDRPLAWKPLDYTVKAILETKAAARIYICENVFERTWGQSPIATRAAFNGIAWTFKSANQQTPSGQPGPCNWCSTSDVTTVDNLIRNVGGWFNIAGITTPNVDSTTRRLTLVNTLIEEEIGTVDYNFAVGQRHDIMLVQPEIHGLELLNFRAVDFAATPCCGLLIQGAGGSAARVRGLVVRQGAVKRGRFGGLFGGGEGTRTLTAWAPNAVWDSVAVLGMANPGLYPPGTLSSAGPTFGVDPVQLRAKLAGVVVPR